MMDGAGELFSTDTTWPGPLKTPIREGRGVQVEVVCELEVKVTAQKLVKEFALQEATGGLER